MRIYPAIDIKGGRCVRLLQGEANQETVYHDDPLEPARLFALEGVEWVHVVDLDGAFTGKSVNLELVKGICDLGLKVQMGGGMRSIAMVETALEAGVSRVVVGTRACKESDFAKELVQNFGRKIAIGLDAKDGKIAVDGWTEGTDSEVLILARTLEDIGITTLIHTDIATGGMMKGPNFAAQESLLERVSCDIIASGGVSGKDDISKLEAMSKRYPHFKGVVVGKAIYEGKISLKDF